MSNIIARKQADELDLIHKVYIGELKKIDLPVETQARLDRMIWINWLIFGKNEGKAWRFQSNAQLITAVKTQFPSISQVTIRKDIAMVQRLFPMVEKADVEFRKMLLAHSIEQNINDAREKGQLKVVETAHRNLMVLFGFDKETPQTSQSIVLNLNGYNPALIGAKPIKNLDELIEKQLAEDIEREKEELGEYIEYEIVDDAQKP